MQERKKVLDFYINGNIHVAFAVVSLSMITYLEFQFEPNFNLLACIALSSVIGYNFVKYFGQARFHFRRLSSELKFIQILSVCCSILLIVFINYLNQRTLLTLFILGILTFLYDFPFLPDRVRTDRKKELRKISGLKIYIIALVWSGVTVVLPILEAELEFQSDQWITFVQRFVLVFVLMLPFEIRDLNYDSLNLGTIPQKIGIRSTKRLGVVILTLIPVLEFFKDDMNLGHTKSLVITSLIILMFLLYSKKQQGRYYCSFWVEAIPIVWLFLMLIF